MTQLIGINGFKTAGKDTVYSVVSRLYEGDVQRAAFADKLKIMAASALGYEGSPDELIALMDEFKESGWIDVILEGHDASISGRKYLQLFGAKARDIFGDTFWIDQVLPKPLAGMIVSGSHKRLIEAVLGERYDADCVCITDVRYPNEAKRVKDLGGVMWEVLRPGLESDGHSSEIPLPPYLVDYKIVNDGDLEVLEGRVYTALEALS